MGMVDVFLTTDEKTCEEVYAIKVFFLFSRSNWFFNKTWMFSFLHELASEVFCWRLSVHLQLDQIVRQQSTHNQSYDFLHLFANRVSSIFFQKF